MNSSTPIGGKVDLFPFSGLLFRDILMTLASNAEKRGCVRLVAASPLLSHPRHGANGVLWMDGKEKRKKKEKEIKEEEPELPARVQPRGVAFATGFYTAGGLPSLPPSATLPS